MNTPNRREFLHRLGANMVAAGGVLSSGWATERKGGSPPSRPNIILFMADDLGFECLGCNGGESYETPELDRLAQLGVRFEHCHSQPLCTPSRVQIMTGQYNFRNYRVFGVLAPGEVTFAHLLQQAGYTTGVVGKWQLYGGGKGVDPAGAGFDEYCLWQFDVRDSRYANPTVRVNGELRKDLTDQYGPDLFRDYLFDFVQRKQEGPFLIYYPMCLTHAPFEPTPASEAWSKEKGKSHKKYFADMVRYMDTIVGQVVGKLEALGLLENTLILFTGDNGTPRGITSRWRGRMVAGGKGLTTDSGTHVPLIGYWKGVTAAGRVCDDLVDFSDFLPTLAEAGGAVLPTNRPLDGQSFLPQLRGEQGRPREWIFCYYDPRQQKGKWPKRRFARDKRYKLYDDGRLFEVRSDPGEEKPLAAKNDDLPAAAARRRLQAVLDQMK